VNENGVWQKVELAGASSVATRHPSRDVRKKGEVAATINKVGKGAVGAVYGPVALNFLHSHHPYLRAFIGDMARTLFPDPAVRVDGPPCIDVALRLTPDGSPSVHLLNTSLAPRSDRFGITDFIPVVGPVEVTFACPAQPKAVRFLPDGGKLKWSWNDGFVQAVVPKLHVHGAVVADL
jgi:hypothetical protein